MKKILTAAALVTLLAAGCGGTGATPGGAAPTVGGTTVTVYSADGLGDWYGKRFAEFTHAQTVQGVEIIQPDWAAVLRDLDADLAAYQKATGQ